MALTPRKNELIADLATARAELGGYAHALKRDADVGAKLKRSVQANPAGWFGAAAVLGLLLSKVPPRRKKVVVKAPKFRKDEASNAGKAAILLAALKFAFDLGKPFLMRWVKNRFLATDAPWPRGGSRSGM